MLLSSLKKKGVWNLRSDFLFKKTIISDPTFWNYACLESTFWNDLRSNVVSLEGLRALWGAEEQFSISKVKESCEIILIEKSRCVKVFWILKSGVSKNSIFFSSSHKVAQNQRLNHIIFVFIHLIYSLFLVSFYLVHFSLFPFLYEPLQKWKILRKIVGLIN
jgi:hypothetical protein